MTIQYTPRGVCSREMQVEKEFEGPMAVCLEGVNVAGI